MGNSSSQRESREFVAARAALGPTRVATVSAWYAQLGTPSSQLAIVAARWGLPVTSVRNLFRCIDDTIGVATRPSGSPSASTIGLQSFITACSWATTGTKVDKLPLFYGLFASGLSEPLAGDVFRASLKAILTAADPQAREPSAPFLDMFTASLFVDGMTVVSSDNVQDWLSAFPLAGPTLDACLWAFVVPEQPGAPAPAQKQPRWMLSLPQPSHLLSGDQAYLLDSSLPAGHRGHWEMLFSSKIDGKSFSAFR